VIKTKGGEFFAPSPANSPNRIDENNLQWAPGTITVHSGQKLKLTDSDKSGEPHVFAIALPKDLPKSPIINPASNKVIRILAPQLLNDPSNPRAGFKAYQAGPRGLSQEGDALVILPGGPHKTASAVVSAKPGTVLHYFCIVHPWMQGEIKVVK
jgi:plastocyanin